MHTKHEQDEQFILASKLSWECRFCFEENIQESRKGFVWKVRDLCERRVLNIKQLNFCILLWCFWLALTETRGYESFSESLRFTSKFGVLSFSRQPRAFVDVMTEMPIFWFFQNEQISHPISYRTAQFLMKSLTETHFPRKPLTSQSQMWQIRAKFPTCR